MKTYGIILASGRGERFGGDLPKQFALINGKTILEHSLDAFEKNPHIDSIILIITPEYLENAKKIVADNDYKKIFKILKGGKARKDSSEIAVNAINDNEANVLIHDCARPFVSQKIIDDCVEALKQYSAVCTAVKATDTILEVKNGVIKQIPQRAGMWQAQTPQGFKLSIIKKAHELSINDNNFTDDSGLVVKHNLTDVHIIEGDKKNMKITYPNDLVIVQNL